MSTLSTIFLNFILDKLLEHVTLLTPSTEITMTTNQSKLPIQNVYVLKIRTFGEEDDVYVFHEYKDACEKAFEYFGMLEADTDPVAQLKELEDWLFEYEEGYLTIFSTNIQ
jgi:hypothetical protein